MQTTATLSRPPRLAGTLASSQLSGRCTATQPSMCVWREACAACHAAALPPGRGWWTESGSRCSGRGCGSSTFKPTQCASRSHFKACFFSRLSTPHGHKRTNAAQSGALLPAECTNRSGHAACKLRELQIRAPQKAWLRTFRKKEKKTERNCEAAGNSLVN